MFGPAGEHHLVWLMKTAGDDFQHTTYQQTLQGRRHTIRSRRTLNIQIRAFARKNRLAPNFRKPEGTIGEHKGGVGAHLTGRKAKRIAG